MDFGNIQTLTHATERDIDLLLVEEFKCNPNFTHKFTSIINKDLTYNSTNVIHSKRRTYNRREIDICLELTSNHQHSYILIENKLDATEQENQAESYTEECETLMRKHNTKHAYAVLVCPSAYKDRNSVFANKFHAVVTYEVISQMLQTFATEVNNNELATRLLYRAELIKQAIGKERRGYEPVIRQEIGEFNKKYLELCREHFCSLKPGKSMLEHGNPSESKTMIFDSKILPKADYLPKIRIVHQLREGNANINLYSWGNDFEKIAPIIRQDLMGTNLKVVATINKRKGGNSGLMLYIQTPPVDNLASFSGQKEAILQGIKITDDLRQWFVKNQALVRKWSELLN